jgi:V8-like Glu-specific endopeptidase
MAKLSQGQTLRLCVVVVAILASAAAAPMASAGDDDPSSIAVTFDEPIAYWRLSDPPGTAYGEEENGGSWTLYYAGTNHAFGETGAIQGGANTAVRLGQSSTARTGALTNIATVELWLKVLVRPLHTRELLRETDAFNAFIRSIEVGPAGGVESVKIEDGSGSSAAMAVNAPPAGTMRRVAGPVIDVADGTWHHIVAVYAGEGSQVYVDGVAGPLPGGTVSTLGSGASIASSPEVPPTSTFGFDNVVLDDIALYPTVLDSDRVLVHSQARYDAPDDASVGVDGEVFDVSGMAVGDEETDAEFEFVEDAGPWNAGADPPLGDTPLELVNPTTGPLASALAWIQLGPNNECSGFVIGRSAVATAAHCVFGEEPSTPKKGREFSRPTAVIVARNVLASGDETPFGSCSVLRNGVFFPRAFMRPNYPSNSDYALLRLDCDLTVRNPDRYRSVCFARDLTGTLVPGTRAIVQGYPFDPPGSTPQGTQWRSSDHIDQEWFYVRTHNGVAPGMSGSPFYRTRTSARCSRPVFGVLHGIDGGGYTAGSQIKLPTLRNLNRWKNCDLSQRRRRCGAAGGG